MWKCYLPSHVWPFATSWTAVHQAPLSMEFFRQVYWSGLPFTSPGDLPNPEIEPASPTLEADSLPSEPLGKTRWCMYQCKSICQHDLPLSPVCWVLFVCGFVENQLSLLRLYCDLALSKENYWRGFLVDCLFSSGFVFFQSSESSSTFLKIWPLFFSVITLRVLFVLVKSSTNESEIDHRWIAFLIFC